MSAETTEKLNRYEQDRILLGRYVEKNSQEAFAQLVRAHQSFVYAVCLREVRDGDMAKDVVQTVFLVLAQKAKSIRRGTALTAWLFQTARFASRDFLRKERTRMLHEQEALQQRLSEETLFSQKWEQDVWKRIDPHMNRALCALKPGERDAVLLRYFDEMSLKEVGAALNLSEDATRMRINRALEKMRKAFGKLGIVIATASLVSVLTKYASGSALPLPDLVPDLTMASMNTPQALVARKVIGKMNLMTFNAPLIALVGALIALSGHLTADRFLPPYHEGIARSIAFVTHSSPQPSAQEQALIRDLTLPENFTLRAESTTQAIFTPEDRQLYVDSHHNVLANSLKTGAITQAQYETNVKAIDNMVADDNPDFHYQLQTVMSSRGKALLMELKGTYSLGHEPYFYFVYDGSETRYFLEPELRKGAGLDFQSLNDNRHWLVMPGVGTAQAPIIKAIEREDLEAYQRAAEGSVTRLRCDLYTVEEAEAASSYARGVALVKKVQGKPQLQSMNPDGLQASGVSEWQFSDFTLFNRVWVAKKIQRKSFMSTTFEPKPGTNGKEFTNKRLPLYQTETHIAQISAAALPASKFDVEKSIPADAERK